MDNEELENRPKEQFNESNENNDAPREGRHPRQRIHVSHAYSSNSRPSGDDGGFRPDGFGSNLTSGNDDDNLHQHSYRPRYNNNDSEGGYQPRQGGYRPRYNNNDCEGGYQPRQGGYNNSQGGGYRPRYNNNDSEGGYQPRQGGYNNRQGGGYRPRYNNNDSEGGYQPRQGGYNNRQGGGHRPRDNNNDPQGGSQPRQGGYNNRQGGGYRPRYNNNDSEGGYQPRQGGYNNRQGGYQPRQGGYNNRQGGYNNRQGGYQPRQHSDDYDPNAKYSIKKRIEYKEENIDPTEPIRLNKFLANAGICSRREADEFIQAGVVTVNGEAVTALGTKVLRTDEVKFNNQPVSLEKKVYVLLNKPRNYVTTSDDPQERKTVMDLVKDACTERIYPVGRLDRNTTGVLLLTNDGDLASKLTHPKFLKKKVYHVFLDKPVAEADIQKIAEGVTLEDGEVHADAIEYADDQDKSQVGIEIHSGKNRIVRRIFESLDYRVIELDRVQFAGLTKKNLRRGDWRYLTQEEVEILRMGAFE